MQSLQTANDMINHFTDTVAQPQKPAKGKRLFTGVDLGTAYIVLAVVDEDGNAITGALEFAEVVKDGLVVDYNGALRIVKELKQRIEGKIGAELSAAGIAYPPGTNESDCRAIRYIAEAAGFQIVYTIDEPTAANNVLRLHNGAIVDIGGGTTGIAILKDGRVIHVDDEPTGGTHFSLVIAGAKDIPFLAAEELKKDEVNQADLLPLVRPVIEKVGTIIEKSIRDYPVDTVYLVGGTCCFENIEQTLSAQLGVEVVKPEAPLWVTPLGIAYGAIAAADDGQGSERP